jgi:pyruvate,orthophosphate dikinase
MSGEKYVYFFGGGEAEGNTTMKEILGGKGANLAEMSNIGLNVPPGFTCTTTACKAYQAEEKLPDGLMDEVKLNLSRLEELTGKKFGGTEKPLFVSVRSGAAVSMPGMMDTVLNLGMNEQTLAAYIAMTGNERAGWDSYRRFINMFGDVVMGIDHEHFEAQMTALKSEVGVELDTDLSAEQLKELCRRYAKVYREHMSEDFPTDPLTQLQHGIEAVYKSWNVPRAVTYRKINKIEGLLGTAVNVQTMVFGNTGETSGTGVCFTRDPGTGENVFYGEFLMNAQGEDVVAGIRDPLPIAKLADYLPECHRELLEVKDKLEGHYKEMEDLEFTIEDGTLYILQTRHGQRTAFAALRIAVEMAEEGLITKEEAVRDRVPADSFHHHLLPIFDPKATRPDAIARGLAASPGAAVGQVVFSADEAEAWAHDGKQVILVRDETSPEDVHGMHAAEGILTARGGMTSHAAVVARGWGKCCVAGCSDITIDEKAGEFRTVGGQKVKRGDWISLDGFLGHVLPGSLETVAPNPLENQHYIKFGEWIEEFRTMGVRTNADTPEDSQRAREFGAEGIGLTRTEHMFFGDERIVAMREMILAGSEDERVAAVAKLLPIQRADFEGIFTAMDGFPVTIRLLDPPLHEFVPHEDENQAEMAREMGVDVQTIKDRVAGLLESNPMLGHRGCRLGITYPEIYDMQIRAILEAACNVAANGVDVHPEIMIPLIGAVTEFDFIEKRARKIAKEIFEEKGREVPYLVGTMIEIPRACLTADEVAASAEFFSFGTNDLTQMAFGYSRDDTKGFLPHYVDIKILPDDPFVALDQTGVGQLVEMGVEKGRAARPDLKVGICGEHGGHPASVKFCYRTGLNYVSCSPFRVPTARLAAAQAALEEKGGEGGGRYL